jgi:hypothetical protein
MKNKRQAKAEAFLKDWPIANTLVVLDTIATPAGQLVYWNLIGDDHCYADWVSDVPILSSASHRPADMSLQVLEKYLSQGLWDHLAPGGGTENTGRRFLLNLAAGEPVKTQEHRQWLVAG